MFNFLGTGLWHWNSKEVMTLLKKLSTQLRQLVLEEGLLISWSRHREIEAKANGSCEMLVIEMVGGFGGWQ